MHKIISLSHIPQQDVKEVVEQHFNKSSIFSYFFWKKKKKKTHKIIKSSWLGLSNWTRSQMKVQKFI